MCPLAYSACVLQFFTEITGFPFTAAAWSLCLIVQVEGLWCHKALVYFLQHQVGISTWKTCDILIEKMRMFKLKNLWHISLIIPSFQELRYTTLQYIELLTKFKKSPTLSESITYYFLLLNDQILDAMARIYYQQRKLNEAKHLKRNALKQNWLKKINNSKCVEISSFSNPS